MSRLIVLDSGVVGIISNPKAKSMDAQKCKQWYVSLLKKGENFALPEIVNYEVRRELIRADKKNGLKEGRSLKAEGRRFLSLRWGFEPHLKGYTV